MERDSLYSHLEVIQQSDSEVITSGNAHNFFQIPDNIYPHRQQLSNRIYGFASQFQGHEGYEYQDESTPLNPLTVPLNQYLDFFAAVNQIWNGAETELKVTSKFNLIKRRRLQNLQDSIGEDAERVAEALVLSIAAHLSHHDPTLARLVGKLEGFLEAERKAETIVDEIPETNTSLALKLDAEDTEITLELDRVSLTKMIAKKIRPVMQTLNLDDSVLSWLNFSNQS